MSTTVNKGPVSTHRIPLEPLEECYAVARWLAEGAPGKRLDTSRVAIAGDSVGAHANCARPASTSQPRATRARSTTS